jgi:AraC-like DNA-binding protein
MKPLQPASATAGLAGLQALAGRLGHRLELAAGAPKASDQGAGTQIARVDELPSGLKLYAADVPMPAQQRLQAEYRCDFCVSLCVEGEVSGQLPDGTRFVHGAGLLGAFHTPGGGTWGLLSSARGGRWRSVAIEVSAEAWRGCLPGVQLGAWPPGAFIVPAQPWLLALASATSLACTRAPTRAHDAAAAALQRQTLALALWQAGLAALSPGPGARVVGIEGARERRAVAQARAALEQQLAYPWTLAGLAAHIGMAPRRLGALFRAAHGQGVLPYLQQQRLLKARQLIEAGASVTQACFEVGYDHTASFSRAFRRAFGHPPRQTPR